jgi:hypothetical protein
MTETVTCPICGGLKLNKNKTIPRISNANIIKTLKNIGNLEFKEKTNLVTLTKNQGKMNTHWKAKPTKPKSEAQK